MYRIAPSNSIASSSASSPAPQNPQWNSQVENAIARGDNAKVGELLSNPSISASPDETVRSLLECAYQHSGSLEMKQALIRLEGFDLNAPTGPQRNSVLELAVQHNDLEFAKCLLNQGARPEMAGNVGNRSAEMHELLSYAQRRNKLYQAYKEPDPDSWTRLDYALHQGEIPFARKLLEQAWQTLLSEDYFPLDKWSARQNWDLWDQAIQKKRPDILRAMLLLCPPASISALAGSRYGSPLQQALALDDPGLTAVIKEYPYQSAKRDAPKNLNCKAQFSETGRQIKCLHLAAYFLELLAAGGTLEFPFDHFESKRTITANVKQDTEAAYVNWKERASEAHLVENVGFGEFMAEQFAAMERAEEKIRLMLVESTTHTMALGLRIKEDGNGNQEYVIKLFDPNYTNSSTRSKARSLDTIKAQTLESYIYSSDLKTYYPEPNPVSMIYVRLDESKEQQAMPAAQDTDTGKMLGLHCGKIDPVVVWHLLAGGFAGTLRALRDTIASQPPETIAELLAGKDSLGTPGLHMALQNGHVEAIKAFGELLKLVPESMRAELIAAKDILGNSGLSPEGDAETAKAFDELLTLIPEEQRDAIRAAKDVDGASALHEACLNGDAEKVWKILELLKLLPEERCAAILAAENSDGISALEAASRIADAKVMQALIGLRKLLPKIRG